MTRRPFDRAAFITGYRAACLAADIDPQTGNPNASADRNWWAQPDLWADPGAAHSSVEAEAIASIAAQARRIAGVPEPETVADAVRAAWEEDGARREQQLSMPLRELHAKRGEIVELVAGVRMLVPIKVA